MKCYNTFFSSLFQLLLAGKVLIKIIPILFLLIFGFCTKPDTSPSLKPTFTIIPDTGTKGDVITIKGKDFGQQSSLVSVTFNDSLAVIKSLNDTIIEAIVPKDAGTGLVKVTVQNTEIIGPEFTYIVKLPGITATSIDSGTFGDLMVIEGINFGDDGKVVSATINGKEAILRKVTDLELRIIVPDGSGTGLVRVIVDGNEVEGPVFSYVAPHPADMFTEAVNIGAGSRPAIVVDNDNGIIHLAYVDGNKLMYRQGDLNGNFGSPEEVLTSQSGIIIWQPAIVLDGNNVPHIAYHSGKGHLWGHFISYTNRIGESWSDVLTVFDIIGENLNGGFNPFITIEGNTVYMTIYIIDFNKPTNAYVRIDNVDTSPIVSKKEFTTNFAVAYPYIKDNGELWVFQGSGSWASRWVLQQLDKTTMLPINEEVLFLDNKGGEQVRWLHDDSGEIYAAGASPIWNNPRKEGWYQTLSRVIAELRPIYYSTSNIHANGGAQPVRDLKATDRVYLAYWNGYYDSDNFGQDGENPYGCTVDNQVQFMRVENGEKAKERRRITSRTFGIHGTSYRTGPAVGAHPDGGMVVIFPECGQKNARRKLYDGPMQLYFTHIGKVQ